MKYINLSKNKMAIVDDENYDYLNQWKWKYHKDGYAVRNGYKSKPIYMHRIINNTPEKLLTDHINRNGLDNRKINLRTVDFKLNAFNSKLASNNTSGFKGVVFDKVNKRWMAGVNTKKKYLFLGRFENIKDAIKIREKFEKEIWVMI